MGTLHKNLPGEELHPPGYVQEGDPGSVGAGVEWFQPSTRRIRRRNDANDGWLEPVPVPGVNTVTADAYTLALTDAGGLVRLSDGTAATLTVPKDATLDFPVGTTIRLEQAGAGAVTIAPEDAAPDLDSLAGNLTTSGEHAVATLVKVAADLWLVSGDLTT